MASSADVSHLLVSNSIDDGYDQPQGYYYPKPDVKFELPQPSYPEVNSISVVRLFFRYKIRFAIAKEKQ